MSYLTNPYMVVAGGCTGTTIEQTNQNATTTTGGVNAKGIALTVAEQSKTFCSATYYLSTSTTGMTGNITVQILNSTGVSQGTLGTIDASTLNTDGNEYGYTFDDNEVSTDASSSFIAFIPPTAIGNNINFYYTTSPSTTDYKGFYQINSGDTPVTAGMTTTFFKFSATYN
tara:strand:+ start:439 stop:951 length:513 start_codon:yes stop_codon:yes gene_type:complete